MNAYENTARLNAGFRQWRRERIQRQMPQEERHEDTMRETLLGIGTLVIMGALFFVAAMWIYGG